MELSFRRMYRCVTLHPTESAGWAFPTPDASRYCREWCLPDGARVLTELEWCGKSNAVLRSIFVQPEQRRCGAASAVMRELTGLADLFGVTLELTCCAYGDPKNSPSNDHLLRWYRRWKFDGPRAWMHRLPRDNTPAPVRSKRTKALMDATCW